MTKEEIKTRIYDGVEMSGRSAIILISSKDLPRAAKEARKAAEDSLQLIYDVVDHILGDAELPSEVKKRRRELGL